MAGQEKRACFCGHTCIPTATALYSSKYVGIAISAVCSRNEKAAPCKTPNVKNSCQRLDTNDADINARKYMNAPNIAVGRSPSVQVQTKRGVAWCTVWAAQNFLNRVVV